MPNLTGLLAGLAGLPQGLQQGEKFRQDQARQAALMQMARAQLQERIQKNAQGNQAANAKLAQANQLGDVWGSIIGSLANGGGGSGGPPSGLFGDQSSGMNPGQGMPGAGAPTSGGYSPSTAAALVPIINQAESGNRNIPNQQGPGGTPASTASGPAQFTNPTWRDTAPQAGIDTRRYPTAMSAGGPPGSPATYEQNAVTQRLLQTRGAQPWQSNPRVAQDIHAALGGQPAAAAAQPIAQSVAGSLPQGVEGRMSLQAMAQLVEKASPPGTPGNVKYTVLTQLSKLLAPSEKVELQEQLNQLREQNSRDLAQFKAGLSAETRGTETPYQQQELTERTRHDKELESLGGERAKAAVTKGQEKSQAQAGDLNSMADEAGDLARIAQQHPEYVGARGKLGGLVSGIGEQLGVMSQDPEKVNFRARLDQFQARAMKALTNTRYFSGVASQRMNQLIPGLGALDNPTLVIQHLNNAARTLKEEAQATQSPTTAVGQGVSRGLQDLSDEQLKRELGLK